ncbi:MAG: hypothetical protein ABJA82_13695 [Myxococcales bacterium]
MHGRTHWTAGHLFALSLAAEIVAIRTSAHAVTETVDVRFMF